MAVVGVPHPDWGEAIVAFVVSDDPDSIVDRVIAVCRTELAKYKVPKEVIVVAELPTTVFGKIDKKSLRSTASI